eukprot:g3970.t1
MEITLDNFDDALPSIQSAIDGADYIAMDLEMTGIRHPKNEFSRLTELLPTVYRKNREVVKTFDVMQIGLCCVKKANPPSSAPPQQGNNVAKNGRPKAKNINAAAAFTCTPLNFYVLKRSIDRVQKNIVSLDIKERINPFSWPSVWGGSKNESAHFPVDAVSYQYSAIPARKKADKTQVVYVVNTTMFQKRIFYLAEMPPKMGFSPL